MSRNKGVLLAAALVFALALLLRAPAGALAPAFSAAGLAAVEYRGTVWRGEALQVAAGSLRLPQVSWRLRPASLLAGRLAADVEVEVPGGFFRGRVAAGLGNRLLVQDAEGAAPLAVLAPAAGRMAPDSRVVLEIGELSWKDEWPRAVVGEVRLGEVALGLPGQASLGRGDFVARFDAPEVARGEIVTGQLEDAGGPVEVRGTVSFAPPGDYEVAGVARARAGSPPELARALELAGPRTPDGGHQFALTGSF